MRLPIPIKYFLKDFLQVVSRNRFIWRFKKHRSLLALTFDDGPDPECTPEILKILTSYNISATFFIVGNNAIKYPEIIKNIINSGHEIGNHSFSHQLIPNLSAEKKKDEVIRNQETIFKISGVKTNLFRPPQTRLDMASLTMLWGLRQQIVFWSVSAEDYKNDGEYNILKRINKKTVQGGDIISFHDDSKNTVKVLSKIITELHSSGFRFCTITDLISRK